MKDKFQSKAVPRGTRTIWRYLSALFILFTFAVGNAIAVETVLFSSFSNTTTSNYFKDYTVDGKTVSVATSGSISSSSGDYYCSAMGSTPSNNNANYVELTVTGAKIKTVSVLITGNGSNKTCQPALLGWEGAIANNTTADYVLVPASQVISNKGLSNAQWHQFDVHGNDLTKVRVYRAVKGVSVAGAAAQTYGNGQTLQFYGIRVELEGLTPVCPSGLSISSKNDQVAFTEGDPIELTATLTAGNGDITYQWYKGSVAPANAITGATNAKYQVASCTTANAGDYFCVASKEDCSDAVNASAFSISVAADTKCFNMPTITSTPANIGAITVSGGTLADVGVGKTLKMQSTGIGFGNGNAARLQVTLTSASIVEGTKITVYYNNASSDGSGIGLYNENYEHQVINETGVTGSGNFSHTFTAAEAANYSDVFLIDRNNTGKGIIVGSIIVEDCGPAIVKHTVTLNYNDGETPAGSLTVVDGNAAVKPADPTRGKYTFLGWFVGDTDNEYVWSTAVTDDITLKAHWQDPWTITFDAGEGSAVADVTVKHNTLAEKPADPTWAGHDFNGWTEGGSPFDWTAPITSDHALVAEWITEVAKYDVEYYDGETKIGTEEQVRADLHPTATGISTDKALYTFVGWYLSSTLEGDPVALNTVTPVEGLKLYGKWNKVYASNADFEAYIIANKSEKDDADKAEAYVKSLNYALSTKTGTTFDANDETNNGAYAGLKIKNAGTVLSWNVVAGKVVELKSGVMVANGSLAINSGTPATIDGGSTTSGNDNYKIHYFYSATEALYEFTTSNGSAEVIKAITMRDPYTVSFEAHGDADPSALPGQPSVTLPAATNGTASLLGWFDAETGGNKIGDAGDSYTPTANITLHAQWEAVSTDARLASITFSSAAGTLEPAFDPEVTNYTYTMPYGTAAVPTITGATSVSAKAQEPQIVSQASAWGETAVIRGVAESSDTKAYNITMKIAPKDGVCLVWADVPADNTLTYNATNSKFYAESDVTLQNSNVKGKDGSAPSGKKFQSNGFLKIALNEGTFLEGDVVALNVTYGTANVMHVFKAQAATSADVIGEATGNTEAGLNKVAITEDASTLWLVRGGDFTAWNPHVDYVAVYRAMNPLLKAITIDGREGVIDALDDHHFNVLIPFEAELDALTIATTIVWNAPHATTPEAVISNEGAWIIGDNTYRVMDKDGDYTDYTITLTRDVKKYTVTYYDGSTVLGTEDVEDGNHPTAAGITVPVKFGSTFEGWSETDGGAVVELSDITISAVKDLFAKYEVIPCPTSGTVYKFEIKDGLASENLPIATDMDMSSYIDATGIGLLTYSATANNKATINSDGTIQLKDATAAYLKVELACALAAGDQIRAHVSNNPIRVQVGTTYDSSKDLILDKNAYDIVDITAAMEGKKELYIARSTNGNANLADFEIYRRPELTGASMAGFTLGVGQSRTPNLILEPSPDAIVNSEEWVIAATTNLTGAAINPTTGEITTGTLDDESIDGTISVKVTLNGTKEATCTVTVVKAYPQANVEESMLWDWSASCWAGKANTKMTGEDIDHDLLMANTGVNIVNSDDFRSDMLIVNGEYAWRTEGSGKEYFQGNSIKFTTTVAGAARVYFRSTGSGKTVEVSINGTVAGSRTNTFGWSDYVVVPAGEVAIVGTGDGYTRIQKIEFLGAIDSRTGYAARELGTVCYEDDAVIFGANTYALSGTNEHGYAVFDEIPSGEIEAGNPYLFESNGGEVLICKKVNANHADDEIPVNGMIGSFLGTTLIPGNGNYYYFSGRNIWRVNDFTVNIPVPAHRCYVDYDVLSASPAPLAPAPGRRRVVLGVNGENQAQGFENIENGDAPMKVMIDGTLYILRGEKVFDATGRLVK